MGKVISLQEATTIAQELRDKGKKVVFTNGIFDLLHLGHIEYLEEAKGFGDVLFVGVNSDESTRKLKGPLRPIIPQGERARIIAALSCVDYVIVFEETTAHRLIESLRPDVYIKGGDYTPQTLPEAPLVESYGGEVVILPYREGYSTSRIIQLIISRFCSDRGKPSIPAKK
ncbi:MAG TPA: D-glycero-beta-D-manno-heptose 1-phosphate adenylyltransferase [Chloroflexi bacterium]|nr:D-glycero-beta-D-manno-heptose 1-phosphate adenylyltransferase [Chloroflexota bacterium]